MNIVVIISKVFSILFLIFDRKVEKINFLSKYKFANLLIMIFER